MGTYAVNLGKDNQLVYDGPIDLSNIMITPPAADAQSVRVRLYDAILPNGDARIDISVNGGGNTQVHQLCPEVKFNTAMYAQITGGGNPVVIITVDRKI